jgi:tetratricopeptide (TPR) repeat protein
MLVTLPVVLLLLDYWPLARKESWSRLVAEKIPLLALSAASSAITLLVQRSNTSIDQLPFLWRLNNAIVTYVAYLWQMFWPLKLAVFYPHPNDTIPNWQIVLALIILGSITAVVILFRQKRPYLFVGWLWYLITLLPVIGLVQVGEQARADRYTYLPQIGLYVGLTWLIDSLAAPLANPRGLSRLRRSAPAGSVVDLVARWRWRRPVLATTAAAIVLLLGWRASVQAGYWKNSESLWNHALAVVPNNDVAHNNLGFLFLQRGQFDEAISHFQSALNIRSQNAVSHYNLGLALIHNNLANALARKRQLDQAMAHYETAVGLRPDYADAHYNFGVVLLQKGRLDEAIEHWRTTVSIQPNDAEAQVTLADALARRGQIDEAITHYESALQLAQASGNSALAAKLRDKIDEFRPRP